MDVALQNKQAFKDVLANYAPSEHAMELLAGMPLVILQGISGSGRNTLINYLVKNAAFHTVVSDTTRPPKVRDGKLEQDGVQYFFRKEQDLLEDLRRGMFLEAELIHDQQVSGISVRELVRAAESGMTPINEVAREGVVNIRKAKPDTIFFFVVPPSYEEWLQRLTSREVMSEEELANRKRSAVQEIDEALRADDFHFLVNDTIERSADTIRSVVSGVVDEAEAVRARAIAESIRAKLTA